MPKLYAFAMLTLVLKPMSTWSLNDFLLDMMLGFSVQDGLSEKTLNGFGL